MDANFITALAAYGTGLITHLGLVNGSGVELSGGSYARKAVTWSGAAGVRSPNADLVFDIPAGATVAGWRGFTASSAGTNYGGAALTSTPFTNAGTYTLLAASTNITVA
jgi:hypothetical protein